MVSWFGEVNWKSLDTPPCRYLHFLEAPSPASFDGSRKPAGHQVVKASLAEEITHSQQALSPRFPKAFPLFNSIS